MLIILPNLKHSFISPVPVPVPVPDPDFRLFHTPQLHRRHFVGDKYEILTAVLRTTD